MSLDAYRRLEERFRRLDALGGAAGVLSWDRQAMMPGGGAEARAEQIAALDVVRHEMVTATETADLLAGAEQADGLEGWQRANLAEMRRRHTHATALSSDLVDALARETSSCEHAWVEARQQDDFRAVAPALDKVVGLIREAAAAKSEALGRSPYDALLDEYEPDGRSADIEEIFSRLRSVLPGLLDKVLDRQDRDGPPKPLPKGPFPIDAQKTLGIRVMSAMGFDFQHGRLDVSAHPFTGGVPDDVRLTTRYEDDSFASSLLGVIHETGHGLYERGLPVEWRGQPVGDSRGMVLHESQSLLMEMQACRTPAFFTFLAPLAREVFGGDPGDDAWSPETLRAHSIRVSRGLIRVDADPVTYPLHVMLRFDLERAMLSGDLAVSDLPGAWRDGLHALLGVTPPDDRQGCLQDIHWYAGSIGYFPTYTLGALAAAQLFAAASAALPGLHEQLSKGDFSALLAWLIENVHKHGSSRSTDDILVSATGSSLSEAAFIASLEARYLT